MASNPFREALRITKETKSLDTILVGNASSYLPEGTHEVRISSVGPATDREGNVQDNQVAIVYEAADGKTYNDRLYLTNLDGTELSYSVRMLLSALIGELELLSKFEEIAATDDNVFEMFTGMQTKITLAYGAGFQVRSTGNGTFVAYELDKKGKAGNVIGEEVEDIQTAREGAVAMGFKRAYLRIKNMESTHAEANRNAFLSAVASKTKPRPAVRVTK